MLRGKGRERSRSVGEDGTVQAENNLLGLSVISWRTPTV